MEGLSPPYPGITLFSMFISETPGGQSRLQQQYLPNNILLLLLLILLLPERKTGLLPFKSQNEFAEQEELANLLTLFLCSHEVMWTFLIFSIYNTTVKENYDRLSSFDHKNMVRNKKIPLEDIFSSCLLYTYVEEKLNRVSQGYR